MFLCQHAAMRIDRKLTMLTLSLALAACAAPRSVVVTDGRAESASAADAWQRTADDYRRAGAPDAAVPAQRQADQSRARAQRPSGGLWDWIVNTLFESWLSSP